MLSGQEEGCRPLCIYLLRIETPHNPEFPCLGGPTGLRIGLGEDWEWPKLPGGSLASVCHGMC